VITISNARFTDLSTNSLSSIKSHMISGPETILDHHSINKYVHLQPRDQPGILKDSRNKQKAKFSRQSSTLTRYPRNKRVRSIVAMEAFVASYKNLIPAP